MIGLLDGAAFGNKPLRFDDTTHDLIEQARRLNDRVEDMAGR
jgi:hypothetical protein